METQYFRNKKFSDQILKIFLFILIGLNIFKLSNATTHCQVKTFLAVAILDRSIVEKFLSSDFLLPDTHPFSSIVPNHQYPVIFEFGVQNNCWTFFTFTQHSFTEFKLEIPYVNHTSGSRSKLYKPLIYVDSYLDLYGSRILYGLNTQKAEMFSNDDSYIFSTSKGKVNVKIEKLNLSEDYAKFADFPFSKYFTEIVSAPWYCRDIFGNPKCANIRYKLEEAKIRPISMTVNINGGILGEELDGIEIFTKNIRDYELGSAEIISDIEIGFPHKCENI
jgi:hypothetical protein